MDWSILKTKTARAGVAMIVAGIATIAGGEWPAGLVLIGNGLAAIFGREAIKKAGNGNS
jgi:hypothetical protein